MKTIAKTLTIILIAIILVSCSKKESPDNSTVEKWHLIEQLIDPGDGSGVFVHVESEKILELSSNGTFSSNGSMCSMTSSTAESSAGSYTNNEIIPDNCENLAFAPISYEISNDEMIIRYQCFEACLQKYTKIK